MRSIGFALLAFVGAYLCFYAFRWWPSEHSDTSKLPPTNIKKVQFFCAVIVAIFTAAVSFFAGL